MAHFSSMIMLRDIWPTWSQERTARCRMYDHRVRSARLVMVGLPGVTVIC